MQEYGFLIPLVAVIAIPLLIFTVNRKRFEKMLEPLARQMGLRVESSFFGRAWIAIPRGGVSVKIALNPGGKNTPPYLTLTRPQGIGFDLQIMRENPISAKLAGWGLMKDVRSGDPQFDDEFILHSKDESKTMMYFSDAQRKEAVRALFADGFKNLRAKGDQLELRLDRPKKENLDPARVERWLENLNKLVSVG